ncbi:purine-cytosine permease related protein [Fructilactobacillus fructivorans]|nr:purine-cytosine permease related protein [Fructilactobacillus fructivorans]KRN43023.1 purine-cytosine permease related protein [Fructilactobacillus fructivorans]
MEDKMESNQKYAFESIPISERDMNYWDMFATWFGANANNGTWFIGGVIAAAGFFGGISSAVIASVIAFAFLSMVGYMGYQTGASTTILSRAPFGIRGSVVPSVINLTLFMGWTAVNTFIAATSLAYLFHSMFGWALFGQPGGYFGIIVGIIIMSILHLLSIIAGPKSVQIIERIGVVLVIIFVIIEVIVVFRDVSFSQIAKYQVPMKSKMPFGVALDTIAAAALGWVVGGADFTRFTSSKRIATQAPYVGAILGMVSFVIIGLCTTLSVAVTSGVFNPNNSDPSTVANKLGLGLIAMVVIVLTSMTANAVNIQSGGSALNNLIPKISLNKSLFIVTILSMILTLVPLINGSFLDAFTAFLNYTGMFLGPIIAILVVDYFGLSDGKYDLKALETPTGRYWYKGGINWFAMACIAIGVVLYIGLNLLPIVKATVGATFISMIVVAIVYYVGSKLMRKA